MATAKTKIGNMMFDVEYTGQKDLWSQLSQLEEVFGDTQCGVCGCEDLKHVIREVDGNEYYELRCNAGYDKCQAKKEFGQHNNKEKTLFPRIAKEGKMLPHNGWTVYVKPKA